MSCQTSLMAVCDVLVHKALESMGKRLVRMDRSRFQVLGANPYHVAHTLWQADDGLVAKAIKGAWDVVPVLIETHGGDCDVDPDDVARMLNGYVHDLVITGTPHCLAELEYLFCSRLGFEPLDEQELRHVG